MLAILQHVIFYDSFGTYFSSYISTLTKGHLASLAAVYRNVGVILCYMLYVAIESSLY